MKNFLAIFLLFLVAKTALSLNDYDHRTDYAVQWKKNGDLYLSIFRNLSKIQEINFGKDWARIHELLLTPPGPHVVIEDRNLQLFVSQLKDGKISAPVKFFGIEKFENAFGPNPSGKIYLIGKDEKNETAIISITHNSISKLDNLKIEDIYDIQEITDNFLYIKSRDEYSNITIHTFQDNKISGPINFGLILISDMMASLDTLYVIGYIWNGKEAIVLVENGQILAPRQLDLTDCRFLNQDDHQGTIYITGKDKNDSYFIIPIENDKILPPTKYGLKRLVYEIFSNGILYVVGVEQNDNKVIVLIKENKIIKTIEDRGFMPMGSPPSENIIYFRERLFGGDRLIATIDKKSHIFIDECEWISRVNIKTCYLFKEALNNYKSLREQYDESKLNELLKILDRIPPTDIRGEDKINFYDFFFNINANEKLNNYLLKIVDSSEHPLQPYAAALLLESETYQAHIFLRHENMKPLNLDEEKEKAGVGFDKKLKDTIFAAILLKIVESSGDDLLKSKIRCEDYLSKVLNALNDLINNNFKDLDSLLIFYKYIETL